jgi:predicted nucleic acid-binding protein
LRIAVIDSGPLINLVHLELAQKLPIFFETIYVPSAVQREVNSKHRFRYRLRKLYGADVFQRCPSADKVNVALLREELDEGEAEGLVQAREKDVRYFIIDEKRGREIASNSGLTVVGTVRILARLNLEGLADEPRALVNKLRRDLEFRVAEEVIKQAIARAHELI